MGGSPRIVCIHQGVELYGSDRSFLQAVTALRESFPGAHITVVLPGEGPLNPLFAGLADRVQVRSLAILRLAEPVKTLLKGTIALPWYLLRAGIDLARADLVYINTAVVADYMLASRLAPRKSVIHVREIPKPKAMPVIRALCAFGNGGLIYNSGATGQAFDRPSSQRQAVVYNGVDPIEGAQPPSVPSAFDSDRPLRLAMLGRISDWKGQDLLIDALGLLNEGERARIRVRIIGSVFRDDPAPIEMLKAQIGRLDLSEVISIEGFMDDPAQAYAWADIVAVPSKLPEPFGRVAIEAMSHGRAPVVAAHGGLVEIVEPECGWLFQPRDPQALAQCLREAIAKPAMVQEKGKAALARFAREFSSETMRTRLLDNLVRWVPALKEA